jgi:hypothetical protein
MSFELNIYVKDDVLPQPGSEIIGGTRVISDSGEVQEYQIDTVLNKYRITDRKTDKAFYCHTQFSKDGDQFSKIKAALRKTFTGVTPASLILILETLADGEGTIMSVGAVRRMERFSIDSLSLGEYLDKTEKLTKNTGEAPAPTDSDDDDPFKSLMDGIFNRGEAPEQSEASKIREEDPAEYLVRSHIFAREMFKHFNEEFTFPKRVSLVYTYDKALSAKVPVHIDYENDVDLLTQVRDNLEKTNEYITSLGFVKDSRDGDCLHAGVELIMRDGLVDLGTVNFRTHYAKPK